MRIEDDARTGLTEMRPLADEGCPADSDVVSFVEISRSRSGWRDALRRYKVYIDDVEVGTLRRGERVRLPVGVGKHVVQVGIDWKLSREFTIEGDGDETFRFRCGPRRGLADIDLFKRGDDTWLFLEQDEPDRSEPNRDDGAS